MISLKEALIKTIYKRGVQANVIKITTKDPDTGKDVVLYKLVDSNGKNISSKLLELIDSKFGAYTSASSAIAALKKIEADAPNTSTFLFDEVELHQGELLFDKLVISL